jgi:hypothetical protein
MKKILCGISVLLMFIACDKAAVENPENTTLSGRYIGIFHRTGMDTVRVAFLFTENRFEGSSERSNYPAICAGTFSQLGNTINFADSCSWTANFDWSLILKGEYNISFQGNDIKIWRTNGAIKDEYHIGKPVR